MSDEKPYFLRIPPTSPRESQRYLGGPVIMKGGRGVWMNITAEEKTRFEKARLHDGSPSSPPLFQIVTQTERLQIDRMEGATGAVAEQEAKLREEQIRSELADTKAGMIAAHERADATQRQLDAVGGQLALVLQLLAKLSPNGTAELTEAPPPLETQPPSEEKRAERVTEVKVPEKSDPKPARPGEKSGKQAKKTDKPDDASAAETESDAHGAADAIKSHDDALKASGVTPNR